MYDKNFTCFRLGGVYTSLKISVDISVKWKENFRGYFKLKVKTGKIGNFW